MERLAASPSAFIRPSPSGGTLGGVARMTRESMLVCEAAGFDVVIVDSTDPVGPARPLFDVAFYRSVVRILADDGVLITQAESPFYDTPMQRRMLAAQRPLFSRLHLYLFPTLTYPGGLWSFGFASRGLCPVGDFDADRLAAAHLSCRYYNAAVHRGAFALPGLFLEALDGLLDPVPL
jgi:spermidine synthase